MGNSPPEQEIIVASLDPGYGPNWLENQETIIEGIKQIFPHFANIALDFVPIVGDIKGVAEAIVGKDITGAELANWERALGAVPVFGGVLKRVKAGKKVKGFIKLPGVWIAVSTAGKKFDELIDYLASKLPSWKQPTPLAIGGAAGYEVPSDIASSMMNAMTDARSSSGATTVRRTANSFVGRDYNSLTRKELAELKKTYQIGKTNGNPTSIKRKKGEVAKGTPQLHIEQVDGKYIIREGAANGSQRLSNANTMKNNYKKANGGTIPEDHQLHHIIPDAVVRENELAREAYDRRIFDLDRASNLEALPDTLDAYNQAHTPLLHRGSHKHWNDYVKEVLKETRDELLDSLGVKSVEKIPDNILKQAMDRVEQKLQKDLLDLDLGRRRGWIKDSKEGLDKLSENESGNNIQSA